MTGRQSKLFQHLLKQGYSQEFTVKVTNLVQNKAKKNFDTLPIEQELSDVLVDFLFNKDAFDNWHHLSAQLIYFISIEISNFGSIVQLLCKKLLKEEKVKFGGNRDKLIWIILQYVSAGIEKTNFSELIPVIQLVHLLYHENYPLKVPELKCASDAVKFSAVTILHHLKKKLHDLQAQNQGGLQEMYNGIVPKSLRHQYQYLNQLLQNFKSGNFTEKGIQFIALLCNASSTTPEFKSAIDQLMSTVCSNPATDNPATIPLPGNGCHAYDLLQPFTVQLLDSLTVHTKCSMLQSIVSIITNETLVREVNCSPALVES